MSGGETTATWDASYAQKGTGKPAPAGDLNNPTGIAVAPNGTIWVADTVTTGAEHALTGVWTVISTPVSTGHQPGLQGAVGSHSDARRQHLGLGHVQ